MTASLPRFQITAPSLPGYVFFSIESLHDYADFAVTEQRAIADFAADGYEAPLWETLLSVGWSNAEIAAVIANPNVCRGRTGFGFPIDFLDQDAAPSPRRLACAAT